MSLSRRPSVSIYDYPEHLNPFSDDITSHTQPHLYREGKAKDAKHKFWTFGRSRKKRSNSFSIKSTWSGLFGKRKEDKSEMQEKRSTITTVSSTYKREPYVKPTAPPRITKDQQEFDEALGTLTRRRKYTLDNSSSRYSSSLTVNGDPARLYDGSPQDTTTSIMGDLTPKPPARRFGQVSPKPTDKIPPLDFDSKSPRENGNVTLREKTQERTPVPPLRRFGNRSSQRTNASTIDSEEDANRSGDLSLCDENENIPGDYTFKRYSQDAVRKSNLSINSCISVGSTMSSYGRKKRRAPLPPRRLENVESSGERASEASSAELDTVEPIDIAQVTENIDEMTKKSKELGQDFTNVEGVQVASAADDSPVPEEGTSTDDPVDEESSTAGEKLKSDVPEELVKEDEDNVQVEYRRTSQENIEIIKDIAEEEEEVCLRRKSSSSTLSRSDSFSVKDEIEKIERQIKALETRNASRDSYEGENGSQENSRLSIHENRRNFFQNMVGNEGDKGAIKIEFKEFPREQKDIHVVRLNDSPAPTVVTREPVKVIELHISEPIRQKAEIVEDVNPIPKPRRHSALSLNDSHFNVSPRHARRILEPTRGKSF